MSFGLAGALGHEAELSKKMPRVGVHELALLVHPRPWSQPLVIVPLRSVRRVTELKSPSSIALNERLPIVTSNWAVRCWTWPVERESSTLTAIVPPSQAVPT